MKRIELKAQLLRTNAQLEEALDTLQKTTRALRAVGDIYTQSQPAIAAATATAGVGRGSSSSSADFALQPTPPAVATPGIGTPVLQPSPGCAEHPSTSDCWTPGYSVPPAVGQPVFPPRTDQLRLDDIQF